MTYWNVVFYDDEDAEVGDVRGLTSLRMRQLMEVCAKLDINATATEYRDKRETGSKRHTGDRRMV